MRKGRAAGLEMRRKMGEVWIDESLCCPSAVFLDATEESRGPTERVAGRKVERTVLWSGWKDFILNSEGCL